MFDSSFALVGAGVAERQCAGLEIRVHRVGQSAGGPSALKGSNPFPGASAYEALGVFLGTLIRTSRVSSRRQLRAWSLVC